MDFRSVGLNHLPEIVTNDQTHAGKVETNQAALNLVSLAAISVSSPFKLTRVAQPPSDHVRDTQFMANTAIGLTADIHGPHSGNEF